MRYAVTALLALAVGITASAPAAHAQMVDRDGNEVVLLQPDGYAAISCYVDGAVVICVQPAPLTLPESQPGPKIGTTKPFTTEANFMSLPGYFRYLMHQLTGQWLTYGQAAGGRWLRP